MHMCMQVCMQVCTCMCVHVCALHRSPTRCSCQGRSPVQLVPWSQGCTTLARDSHGENDGASAVAPSCVRRMQPSTGEDQTSIVATVFRTGSQAQRQCASCHECGALLAWKESNIPLLWGAGCSRDVAGGGLGHLTVSRLAVLAPTWVISASPFPAAAGSSCFLLPAPASGITACRSLCRRCCWMPKGSSA